MPKGEVKKDNPKYKGGKSPSGDYLSKQGSSGRPNIGSIPTPQTGTGTRGGGNPIKKGGK